MASSSIRPVLVVADENGNIYDEPDLFMVCRKGRDFALPKPEELMPLPAESELFLLPGRHAVGLDPQTGELVMQESLAVAAFAAPAHTLTAHPAYESAKDAPMLPLFAYGAIGFANGRFYICAKKVDDDPRQVFKGIAPAAIQKKARAIMKEFPENRLIQHIMGNCALKYACPAARNLALGRYEAPLPVSRACNARCVGCISQQDEDSNICSTPQNRMSFTPTADEIVGVMELHAKNETRTPIFSFGQGCEGEPLTESTLIASAIRKFRERGGRGTVNMNSNASLPDKVTLLADSGLTSLRVSLNSAREASYEKYYRPKGYTFADVRKSMNAAKEKGVYLSLNLLFFPGFTDTEAETEALAELVREHEVDLVQLRNLNIDPEYYLQLMEDIPTGPCLGFANFRKRLQKARPGLKFGYFNPFVPEKDATQE